MRNSLRSWACGVLVAASLGCEAEIPRRPGVDAGPLSDAKADVPAVDLPAVTDAGPPDTGVPYDAGAPPRCDLTAGFGRVLERGPDVRVLEPGALLRRPGGGWTVALRQSAPRNGGDGGISNRDTVDLLTLGADGTPARALATAFTSGAEGTDVATPSAVPLPTGALMVFNETRGFPGGRDFITRVRTAVVGADGATRESRAVLEDHAGPFAATLPDGLPMLVASRVISQGDAGVVARPVTFRLTAEGLLANPSGVDITNFLPVDSSSVLFRPHPGGAAMLYLRDDGLHVTRFEASGVVDPRIRVTPGLRPPRIDDAALVNDSVVIAWAEALVGMWVVEAAVLGSDGRLLHREELERGTGVVPRVAVAASYGGAAVLWVRGSADAAALRGAVVQPDGRVRVMARDLMRMPGAEGRLLAVADGRAVAVVSRTRPTGDPELGFGRVCLPE